MDMVEHLLSTHDQSASDDEQSETKAFHQHQHSQLQYKYTSEGDDDDHHAMDISNLPTPLKLLYAFNGATEGFPTLALTAIINDRIQIPLSFIPAYYAVEFLPYSLKPLYAIATNLSTTQRGSRQRIFLTKDLLLIILLLASAAMILMTAFLRKGQLLQCFLIAFARGVFISWAEFIVGLHLIFTAKLFAASPSFIATHTHAVTDADADTDAGEMNHHGTVENSMLGSNKQKQKRQQRLERLLSTFQSQAASSRNVGSLLAHLVTFAILFFQMNRTSASDGNGDGNGDDNATRQESQMTDGLVNFMLIITSLFPIAAAFVAVRYRVYKREASCTDDDTTCSMRSLTRSNVRSLCRMSYDLIALLLFQTLLVLIGLKTIIIDAKGETFFKILSISTGVALVLMLLCSRFQFNGTSTSCRVHKSSTYLPAGSGNGSGNECNDDNDAVMGSGRKHYTSSQQHLLYVKRTALYLILRHASPSSGVMLSSYTYTKLRSKPLLLQTLSILGSVAALLSTWAYGKRIAKKYSSLSGLKRVIIATTFATSLWSLCSIYFVHEFRQNEDGDGQSSWNGSSLVGLYALFQLTEGFLGELAFLPSVILATTSTAFESSIGSDEYISGQRTCSRRDSGSSINHHVLQDENVIINEDDSIDPVQRNDIRNGNSININISTEAEEEEDYLLDDGLQYGLLISCIDFGDQLGDFISMPIVGRLGMSRENDWENLEWFVVICAALGIVSLTYLKLLRH